MRSPTAEYVARKRGLLATSCATSRYFSEGLYCVPISPALIEWASIIICMEPQHVERVRRYPAAEGKDVRCWHIPDEYQVYDATLVALCEARLDEALKGMGYV